MWKVSVFNIIKICATPQTHLYQDFPRGLCVDMSSFVCSYNGRDPNEMRWVGSGDGE